MSESQWDCFFFSDSFRLSFYFNHALWAFVHEGDVFILPIVGWHCELFLHSKSCEAISTKVQLTNMKSDIYNIFTQSFLFIYFQSLVFGYVGELDLFKHKDIFLRINRSYRYGIYIYMQIHRTQEY